MKRPAELDDKDRLRRVGTWNGIPVMSDPSLPVGVVTVKHKGVEILRFEPDDATPATPPAFPWRRFLSRLAWWAVLTLAGAFVAAEVWP